MGNPVTNTWKLELGSLSGTPVVSRDLNLDFNAGALFDQLDTHPGRVVAKLFQGETLLAETFWTITVLPANYWMPGSTKEYQTLAAFSQPNDPALQQILDKSADDLRRRNSAASWSGYQSLQHVDEMVESLFTSVQSQKIVYSNPPASWDIEPGQAVRSAQQILNEKLGTCLDTAVLFASLIERIGLYPILILVPGHAFVGYWTSKVMSEEGEHFRPQRPLLPVAEMINLVDLGYIRMFETTKVAQSENPVSFAQALTLGNANLTEYQTLTWGASASLFIDIVAARSNSEYPVRPLPVRVTRPDGTIEIIEYKPAEFNISMLREQLDKEISGRSRPGTQISTNVPPMVKMWLDQLLDLSLRNPLINFRNPKSCVPLVTPKDSLGVIEDLLQQDKVFRLVPNVFTLPTEDGQAVPVEIENDRGQAVQGADDALAKLISEGILVSRFMEAEHPAQLRKMVNAANLFQEETGSNGLFLALGMLKWQPKDSKEVDSPLILVPVRITPKNRGREYFLSIDDSGITPNFSLVEKIKRELGIELPRLANLELDQSGIDVEGTFQYVREELAKAGLNQFRVDERAVLGFFNFSSYRLWRDLLDNWKTFEKAPLVNHLINTPTEAFIEPSAAEPDQDLDDLIAKLPIESDGSQATAVAKALAGHTFVLQGPPGTGKSQTIANLLARALHEGKRILFVAQKQDALEVVKERLERVGLGAFSLDLFDKASTTKAVREQLAAVIDITVSADTIGFESAVSEYDGTLPSLTGYRERLHSNNQWGESVYTARLKYLNQQGSDHLSITGDFIANAMPQAKDELFQAANSIVNLGPVAGTAERNPWSLTALGKQPSQEVLDELKIEVTTAFTAWASLSQNHVVSKFILETPQGEDLSYLSSLTIPNTHLGAVESARTTSGQALLKDARQSITENIESLKALGTSGKRLASFDPDFWIGQAQIAIAGSAIFRGSKLKGIRKKVALQLNDAFAGENGNLVTQLEGLKAAKVKLNRAFADLGKLAGYRGPTLEDLTSLDSNNSVLESLSEIESLATLANLRREAGPQPQELLQALSGDQVSTLLEFLIKVERIRTILLANEFTENLWQQENTFWQRLVPALAEMHKDATEYAFSQLTQWIDLLAEVNVFYSHGLDSAAVEMLSGKVPFENTANAFLKGFYLRLLDNLVVTRGFNTFNEASLNNSIRKMNDSHKEIRDRLPRILASELLERRGFDSSMRVGAIGDLIMTIKQAKRNLPLRTMLAKHWEIINQVTPLVLASPDSCVRFIDPESTPFDLVVFDEASQIRVATSIGALGRARAAVIVGDSQQMPPTSVAQSKNESDEESEEEDVALASDIESILSMCEVSRVPEIMLTWHYRSDDEALIAYSNQRYYEGKLNTFPSPLKVTDGAGLKFENVRGQFIRSGQTKAKVAILGTNPIEAQAIIDEIAARLSNPETANDSIGVVTLNQPQQRLIQDMLQTSTNKAISDAMENGVGGEVIFVKNLETVQGSERDVILLSVAFSPRVENPNVLPLNFGPINNNGGHRRLNVAITRARKYVKIFASFEPALLTSSNPNSTGLQHLGEYLTMAKADDKSGFDSIKSQEEKVDRHRRDIMAALQDAGLPVAEEIGMSDFKVDIAIQDPKDPNKSLVGILLDGERWNDRKTVSDRDSLPVNLLLNRMGWQAIDRIWLPAWIRDRQGEINRIKELYERTKAQPRRQAPKVAKPIAPVAIVEQKSDVGLEPAMAEGSRLVDLLEDVKPWVKLQPTYSGHTSELDSLFNSNVAGKIQEIAKRITKFEGPVSPERLAKHVATCFGLTKVVSARVAAINGMRFPGQLRDREGFLFPEGSSPSEYELWHKSDVANPRKLEEISLHEIGNALAALAKVSQGLQEVPAMREVLAAFGIQKLTSGAEERLRAAIALAVKDGKLSVNGEYLVSAK
jgi:hypothetical protein